MVTTEQYNVSKQTIRNQHIKINLLNYNMQTVDEFSGNVLSGSVSIDANADIRRTCNIEMVVTDSSFDIQPGGKIYLDKYIQVYVGIDSLQTGEIVWFNYGIYLIDAPGYTYDAETHSLSFQGLDLMSKLTGQRNGYLPGIPTKIPQGSSVRDSIISTLTQLGGFSKYVVEECRLKDGTIQTVPYDITIDQGGTVYDVLTALDEIMPYYRMFFDVDGVFHYEPIPTGQNEVSAADDDILSQNLISESIDTDFSSVKNYIEVYGRTHDIEHYSSNTTLSGSILSLTIASLTTLTADIMIGFTTPSAVSGNIQLNVNSIGAKNLVDSSGNIITSLDADTYYIAVYQSNDTWKFMGHQQAYGYAQELNPNSPFYTGGTIGTIRTVKYGSDYDNIMSDELALERAKYELWLATNMQDSINLTLVPIHFLDVNQLISHTIRNTNIIKQYIIKSISVDLSESGTQTINAITYYPLYPEI